MERVFKIKTRSEPDLFDQYPSERRYSSSMVLGLSAVLLQFGLCSILMGALIVHKMSLLDRTENETETESTKRLLAEKLQRDMEYIADQSYLHYYINVPALVSAGCFVMAFGDILAFIAGMFAWKHWYVDHNITVYFLTCSFCTLTSCISLLIAILTASKIKFDTFEDFEDGLRELSPLTLPLAANVIVLSLLGAIWSILASKIAYRGMRNSYPEDIVVKGRVKVTSTVNKGNQNISHIPIEVINNFAVGKMAKYLPKKENTDLPKRESDAEYQQRVNKFLSDEAEQEPENEISKM